MSENHTGSDFVADVAYTVAVLATAYVVSKVGGKVVRKVVALKNR
jgi:hypothetical protein